MKRNYPLFILMFLLLTGIIYGDSKVKIEFDRYHNYKASVKYLKKVAAKYPGITELKEIGTSNQGRKIYVLVVSNMNNGKTIDSFITLKNMRKEGVKNVLPMKSYQGKPGHWICGSMHGNEFTGTETCLYIIDKLIEGYQNDQEIKNLVDQNCFYICPIVNPDGFSSTLEKGISQRNNCREKDDDNDGKINEDGPDDLNNDGFVTRFRYKDKKGRYVLDDIDTRLMRRLGKNEKTDKQRYNVITEDIDNDGDGKRGEDSERGIDLNRNFPEGWFKDQDIPGGSGEYPTSAPESHAIAEFFSNHRNILIAQFYHTSGGFTFRPMGTAPDSEMSNWDRAVFDQIMGKKYLQIIGDKIPAPWLNKDSLAVYKKQLSKSPHKIAAKRGYMLPRGWKVSYNERNNKRYSYGMATDWAYKQFGIYSITTELWNPAADIKDFPAIEGKDKWIKTQRALLKFQDNNYNGKLFVNWTKYKHPQLGMGEIGGWKPGRNNNAFPGAPLVNVCEKHWQFEKFRAGLLPQLQISNAVGKVIYSGKKNGKATKIIEITVKIKNNGSLATNVAAGSTIPLNRDDVIWLICDRNKVSFLQGSPYQKLGILDGQARIPGFKGPKFKKSSNSRRWRGRRSSSSGLRKLTARSLKNTEKKQEGSERTIKWLVSITGDSALKVVLTSLKGGTVVKKVSIR